MSNSLFSPSAYSARPLMAHSSDAQPATQVPPPSTGMARDMVRGLSLMLIAAVMAVLVLLTERLLLARADVGTVLGWMVLWSVLLSALLLLSRVSVRVSHAVLTWLDSMARRSARSRAKARFSAHSSTVIQ